MSSSYVKYTMNGDSQRSLCGVEKTHRPQSTGAEFISHEDIYTLALLEKKREITHPNNPNNLPRK